MGFGNEFIVFLHLKQRAQVEKVQEREMRENIERRKELSGIDEEEIRKEATEEKKSENKELDEWILGLNCILIYGINECQGHYNFLSLIL